MYITIEYINHKGVNGGLGDRIFGFISALMISKFINRKVLIKWDFPNVSHILDFGEHDYYKNNVTGNTLYLNNICDQEKYKNILSNNDLIQDWQQYQNIMMNCNNNMGQYIYLNKKYVNDIKQYHDDIIKCYKELYTIYWKPKGTLKDLLYKYENQFDDAKKTKKILGLHMRCGNQNFGYFEGVCFNINSTNNILVQINDFIKTNNLDENNYCIFYTCDHPYIKACMEKSLEKYQLIYIDGDIIHIDKTDDLHNLYKVFLDQIMLSKTDIMIIPDSNLSRIARILNYQNKCYTYIKNNDSDIFNFTELDATRASSRHDLIV